MLIMLELVDRPVLGFEMQWSCNLAVLGAVFGSQTQTFSNI